MNSKLERQVQWYPGHMAKALRAIREYLSAVDVVIEVVDARVARSGRNPVLDKLVGARTHIVALDRDDLADRVMTKRWVTHFAEAGSIAIPLDGRDRGSVMRLATAIAASPSRQKRIGIARAMIVGIPNSGKSTIVNALLRRSAAKTEARAGVTRHVQWFRLAANAELMDTPGVLPPKIATPAAQWKLAMCAAVPRERFDAQEVIAAFHDWLLRRSPKTTVPDLQGFAEARGFVRRGGELDLHNAAHSYIRAFNDGAFGRISLEAPDDAETT